MTFEAIRRSSAPEMVAEQIVDQITTGELPPGTRLPAQRDLARMLGVGRSSKRCFPRPSMVATAKPLPAG